MTPHIKILILNWNGVHLLKPCLDSVNAIDYPNFSVVVIDNGSSDGSLEMISAHYPNLKCIGLDKNYGFAGGYNRYFAHLSNDESEFILLLNNDTEVDSNILNSFIQAKKQFGDNQIYGGKIYYRDNPEIIWYAGGKVNLRWGRIYHRGIRKMDSEKYSFPITTDYITGCCLFIAWEKMQQLRGFDDQFHMFGEDVDLCLRAKKEGIQCYYWPEAKLWHHVSGSINGAFSIGKLFSKYRSLFKLYFKHN